ncbi:RagB/SusD family nutrient uptake outer membrane protein [Pedobacter hiemivivus]|uniref:RagB/SusD family nutrient uptake outer membrane protein n=1 Tax=Pedobacter hiemivivus TaxID=2530454 RepID=A0A4R0NDK8_9SPHI|nr:RagB/SusD family nutrient uptake outer membrane protein [Pedobacter hiemivivus]TCC98470.1 RagB/SusD family nutrient uptake outer membrane protein [Pedobacter hiemivivus]
MNKYKINSHYVLIILIMVSMSILSCDKQNEWLDVKSNKGSVVPETLSDYQAILDNSAVMNDAYSNAGLIGSDNLLLNQTAFNAAGQDTRNLYNWDKDLWVTGVSYHWNNYYKIIGQANIVLDGIQKIASTENDYSNVKGQALFHRAMIYYELAQLFCSAYHTTMGSDLGLPLRNHADVNLVVQRSSLLATYQQIINDALEASNLLSDHQPYLQRPVKAAAYALLAKAYLNMGDYQNASTFADKCLSTRPQLLDYNSSLVVPSSTYRFPFFAKNNPEVLFYAQGSMFAELMPFTSSRGQVSVELYQSYAEKDLRKTLLFVATDASTVKFRGAYTGKEQNFCGLATNEIYLIRAECNARQEKTEAAMADLNKLLINRYVTGEFSELSASDSEQALALILQERRKELPFTGNIRWEDLKRLNKETRFQTTLSRTINGVTYTLAPNDKRYVLSIPQNEIELTGILQNER